MALGRHLLALPAAALAALGSACADPQVGPPTEPQAVEVVDLDGLRAGLAELRGKPVVLNFWATWCPPCLAEMPALHALAEEAPHDVQVRTVSWDLAMPIDAETPEDIAAFAAERGMWLPVWAYDDSLEELAELYDLDGSIPATLVFDAEGALVGRHVGAMSLAEFTAFVDESLSAAAG